MDRALARYLKRSERNPVFAVDALSLQIDRQLWRKVRRHAPSVPVPLVSVTWRVCCVHNHARTVHGSRKREFSASSRHWHASSRRTSCCLVYSSRFPVRHAQCTLVRVWVAVQFSGCCSGHGSQGSTFIGLSGGHGLLS